MSFKMFLAEKEPWQIAAARFFVENSERGFNQEEFRTYIKSKYTVADRHVVQFFREEIEIPTGRDVTTAIRDGAEGWVPPLDLVSRITDYDELREARRNARHAWWFSLLALAVSALGAFFQYLSI